MFSTRCGVRHFFVIWNGAGLVYTPPPPGRGPSWRIGLREAAVCVLNSVYMRRRKLLSLSKYLHLLRRFHRWMVFCRRGKEWSAIFQQYGQDTVEVWFSLVRDIKNKRFFDWPAMRRNFFGHMTVAHFVYLNFVSKRWFLKGSAVDRTMCRLIAYASARSTTETCQVWTKSDQDWCSSVEIPSYFVIVIIL